MYFNSMTRGKTDKTKGGLITVNHDVDLWEKSYEKDRDCEVIALIKKGDVGIILEPYRHECLVFFAKGKGWMSRSNIFEIIFQ